MKNALRLFGMIGLMTFTQACTLEDDWADQSHLPEIPTQPTNPTYEYLPSPTLQAGECKYERTGYESASSADTGMTQAIQKLEDASEGGFLVPVTRFQTFPYAKELPSGNVITYGYQVVYACADAQSVNEKVEGFESQASATVALQARVFQVQQTTPRIKILDQTAPKYSVYLCQYAGTQITCPGSGDGCVCGFVDRWRYLFGYLKE